MKLKLIGMWMTVALAAKKKHHFLMIASDDMRPEMSPYGHDYMHTPNFQALADDGFTFRRSYVQQALCGPSRTVLLTGRRPDTSRVWTIGNDNDLYFRHTTGRNWTTLPQFFKNHGYRAIGHGKIFHEGNMSGFPLDQDQLFGSWSVPYFHPSDPYNKYNKSNPKPPGCTHCSPLSNGGVDEPWQTFNDAKSALRAVEWIKNASKYDEPFFLAVGFHRPHIPYIYPKEFEYQGEVSFPPSDYAITKDIPPCAPHDWTQEGMRYGDLRAIRPSIIDHNFQRNLSSLCAAVPLAKQQQMKRSYYSCIQYIDHLVGQLTSALREEGLYDSTTIIFWGDHGYKLGEHCDWFKHDNYEDSTRIPVLVKPAADHVLGKSLGARGSIIEQLVEEVDIFPSLVDLGGFAVPGDLMGESWVPLLQKSHTLTNSEGDMSLSDVGKLIQGGKEIVFSQYPRYSQAHKTSVMGYSMRTKNYRYTEWIKFNCDRNHPMKTCPTPASAAPHWGDGVSATIGVELYNHTLDTSTTFADFENVNLAYVPEHTALVQELRHQLRSSWPKLES